MNRALLTLAFVAALAAAAEQASSRPPDQVPRSPIPPLQAPARAGAAHSSGGPATVDPNLHSPARISESDAGAAATQQAEQLRIWNSPAMVEARAAVQEFSRLSAQTSPAEGEEFLARLSQLPPEEMQNWLDRYQAGRRNSARGQAAQRDANRRALEQGASRQAQARQAGENAANLRNETAATRFSPVPQPFVTKPLPGPTAFPHSWSYDPLDPVFDPMSPRGYRRRMAAAASLPGDLPRDDPRNFIRGEAGVDTGASGPRE